MPTHKKGRDRDKYYHLAKDQGYRSRAAFKLIQINKRFDFLTKARVLIDLCAAPGGWCQVASKFMPAGSIVLGVDLLPIRAIRNVKTIVADITTAECRKMVVAELQGWKADVVLCDGAPDIGGAYSKDAYVQNELVLAALKTATEHLVKGGTFCTKVYRSVDYNSLMWVFQQLFEEVQAIKPSSSRSQSSEIFIVCLKYTCPKQIDPKLLDPNHVFKEVADGSNKVVDVLHRKSGEHNKRNRSGYDETLGILLRKKLSVSEFIETSDPVRALTDYDEIYFSDKCSVYKSSDQTKQDIIDYMNDLRILSKSEFKKILKWRQQLRDSIFNVKEPVNDEAKTEESIKSPKDIDEEIASIQDQMIQRQRREEKKSRRDLAKERKRKELGILNNAFEESGNDDLFSLAAAANINKLEGVNFDELEVTIESDDENDNNEDIVVTGDDLDKQLEEDYIRYITRVNSREKKITKKTKKSSLAKDFYEDNDDNYLEPLDAVDNEDYNESDNQVNKVSFSEVVKDSTWFDHPLFKETLVDKDQDEEDNDKTNDDADIDIVMPKTDKAIRREKRLKVMERNERRKVKRSKLSGVGSDDLDMKDFEIVKTNNDNIDSIRDDITEEKALSASEIEYRNKIKLGMGSKIDNNDNDQSFEIVPSNPPLNRHDDRIYDSENEDYDDDDRITTLALGTLMLDKSRKKAIIDSSYNRYSWNDSKDLPKWFLDDDHKYNKPQLPIPNGLIQNIKKGFQDVGSKEIKKVAEARMRKRKRAMTKLKAAKKKATSMAESSELSGRLKVKAIAQAMKEAKISKPGKVYVVAKKTKSGSTGNMIGSGKGRLKFVDKRMRKDQRGEKNKKKKSRKR